MDTFVFVVLVNHGDNKQTRGASNRIALSGLWNSGVDRGPSSSVDANLWYQGTGSLRKATHFTFRSIHKHVRRQLVRQHETSATHQRGRRHRCALLFAAHRLCHRVLLYGTQLTEPEKYRKFVWCFLQCKRVRGERFGYQGCWY